MIEQRWRAVSTVISLIIFKYGLLIAVFRWPALTRAPKGPVESLPPASVRPWESTGERGVLFIDLVPSLFHRTLSSPLLVNRRPVKPKSSHETLPFSSFSLLFLFLFTFFHSIRRWFYYYIREIIPLCINFLPSASWCSFKAILKLPGIICRITRGHLCTLSTPSFRKF